METFIKILLFIHVIAGITALVAGIVPMIAKKGGTVHNQSGLIYFWAMFAIFLTAQPISLIKGNVFLFTIGIFSFYFVLTGYRFAKKKGWENLTVFDKRIMQITFITSIIMLVFAVYLFYFSASKAWIVLGIFGFICLRTSFSDLQKFGVKGEPKSWFFEHLNRMIGGYIATFTAFAVNILDFLPGLVLWLAPTLIGVTGIILTIRYYKKKFGLTAAKQ